MGDVGDLLFCDIDKVVLCDFDLALTISISLSLFVVSKTLFRRFGSVLR